ncbi:hypothetical protein [Frigoriglobus tundricola]|uniref:hypothetical protein n=1 Tax=Frigoriglobus tundricola TaxID=2774151 RepID=UPI00148EBD70|nr:hypothetical protein [Frigoriglobus tundricola]
MTAPSPTKPMTAPSPTTRAAGAPAARRPRRAHKSRAKWVLLIKIAGVVALGVAAVIAVSAARGRLADRRNEAQKVRLRR